MTERVPYDEFAMFGDNAAEYAIPYDAPPVVRREKVLVSGGRSMSALAWARASRPNRQPSSRCRVVRLRWPHRHGVSTGWTNVLCRSTASSLVLPPAPG